MGGVDPIECFNSCGLFWSSCIEFSYNRWDDHHNNWVSCSHANRLG
jgi:hypothetical protein